jgi:hypothetical protein
MSNAKKYNYRHSRVDGNPVNYKLSLIGTTLLFCPLPPAKSLGGKRGVFVSLDSRFRGNDGK